MKKNILIFIGGIIAGVLLLYLFAAIFGNRASVRDDIMLFDSPSDCVSTNSFKVFQVLESGDALAHEIEGDYDIPTGLTVLFLNKDGRAFYDDQTINVGKGKCARQIGVFRYISKNEMERTVPVVDILNK